MPAPPAFLRFAPRNKKREQTERNAAGFVVFVLVGVVVYDRERKRRKARRDGHFCPSRSFLLNAVSFFALAFGRRSLHSYLPVMQVCLRSEQPRNCKGLFAISPSRARKNGILRKKDKKPPFFILIFVILYDIIILYHNNLRVLARTRGGKNGRISRWQSRRD